MPAGIPLYMIIIGDKDIENNTISVRCRGGEDIGTTIDNKGE